MVSGAALCQLELVPAVLLGAGAALGFVHLGRQRSTCAQPIARRIEHHRLTLDFDTPVRAASSFMVPGMARSMRSVGSR
jgi:hypothetical protein